MTHYDVIIIGAGQAGLPLARKLAKAGKKTCLIEKRFVGGTCINDGCTPTKTMIVSARAAHQPIKAKQLGIETGPVLVDFKAIKARKDKIVEQFRTGSQKSLETIENLTLIFGDAQFSGKKDVLVMKTDGSRETVSAEWIFINTGTSSAVPEISGLSDVGYLTSTSILDLEEIPEHLLIIGGSYIALEFGQMFHRFGSRVTILERSERIMSKEDADISLELRKILENEGLGIITEARAEKFTRDHDGGIKVEILAAGTMQTIACSHVLVAIGRQPQTGTLALDQCGVILDSRGYVQVNERLETNVAGIWALGDVNGGPAFTHISYNDHIIVYENLMNGSKYSTKGRTLPYCMFTDPQLGRVGISEQQAKSSGLNFKVVTLPMANVARGIETGETLGLMKALVDPVTKKILGAAILAEQGGEVISVLQMAIEGGITYDRIRSYVFAHPTYSESLNNLFMKIQD
ncbi:mercuric reductase [Pedobacter miscanthi]|uniref:FAD-containing oxidoreductase n=1 Tax=Pedobacter miscanthi TaxID=2259170 RepID=A0A366L2H0_9SPHI|nr:mercuric reductase [Pedobacter miscanthi]RBQ07980.1 FAD-containing oxidoreductase [Pedobacter miscanthi]